MIFLLQWVRTHPQVQSWSIISRTIIVVHTGLLVQILGIEEIRCVPRIVAFFNEYFPKWNVFDMLRYFAIKVGDVTTATQVVRMIVELHLFVVVVRLEVTACSSCACHCQHKVFVLGLSLMFTDIYCFFDFTSNSIIIFYLLWLSII